MRAIPMLLLSSEALARYAPAHGGECCISITSLGEAPAMLASPFTAVLRLTFDDVDIQHCAPADVPFTEAHAHAVLAFVLTHPETAQLVIHSPGDLRRAAAIALGLCDAFGWPADEMGLAAADYNRSVRRLLGTVAHQAPQA